MPNIPELLDSDTPHIVEVHSARNRAVDPFRESYVIDRRGHVRLVDPRLGGMRKYLVHTTSRHDITADEERDLGA